MIGSKNRQYEHGYQNQKVGERGHTEKLGIQNCIATSWVWTLPHTSRHHSRMAFPATFCANSQSAGCNRARTHASRTKEDIPHQRVDRRRISASSALLPGSSRASRT